MAHTLEVTKSILAYNRGRDPVRLRRKFELLRRDPFSFFRGTCHLFFATLPRDAVLARAPAVLTCGDLHLENLGTYKGDNRLVYFDLIDFDEAALAPFTLELARFVTSVLVAAEQLGVSKRQAAALCDAFMASYRRAITDGKPRWIERSTADGMVKDLLDSLALRSRCDVLDARTQHTKTGRRLTIDARHSLAARPADRSRITALLKRFAATTDNPRFYRVLDVAQRIAGNGSLGVERYVLLVEGRGSPDNNYLLDLKLAIPSALGPVVKTRQPKWASEAQRVVTIQRITQAISPALLHAVKSDGKSYVLKELQPTADRLDLALWHGHFERLHQVVFCMAEVTAWDELRSCGRYGAASVEELQRYVAGPAWEKSLLQIATGCCAQTIMQWREYCKAYDRGQLDVIGN